MKNFFKVYGKFGNWFQINSFFCLKKHVGRDYVFLFILIILLVFLFFLFIYHFLEKVAAERFKGESAVIHPPGGNQGYAFVVVTGRAQSDKPLWMMARFNDFAVFVYDKLYAAIISAGRINIRSVSKREWCTADNN